MKNNQIAIGIFVLIGLVAILTNPKLHDHKEAVKTKISSSLQKNTNSDDETDTSYQLGRSFGNLIGGVLIDQIIDNIVSIDNYVLFSLTKVSWDGETKVIGYGLFGNVFFSSELEDNLAGGLINNNN